MPSRSWDATRVVFCLFCVLFLGVADNQVLSPLLPAIRAQVGKSSQQMGWLFTGYSLTAGISVLLWGPLSDFFGSKKGLLCGLLVFASGSAISFSAGTFAPLLMGRVVTGMGASMLSLNTLSYAAAYFPYEKRGWAMGSIVSSYFAALILGVPVGSVIGYRLGWNAVFALACATALIMLATVAFALPSPAQSTRHRLALIEQGSTYLGFLRARTTLGGLLSSLCASAGTMGFLAFLGVWLNDAFGVSGQDIGIVFVASGAAALLASPLAGLLSDRIGKKPQFVASNVALALLLVILPGLRWGVLLFAVFAGISVAAAFRQGPMEALMTELVPGGSRGSFIALKNAFSQLGIGLAALACGILFESAGYTAVCLFCAGANLLAALGVLLLVRGTTL